MILPVEPLLDTQLADWEVEWHVSPCLSRGPQKFGWENGRYESVDCSTGMEWWNGILE